MEDDPNDSVLVRRALRASGLACDYQCVATRVDFEDAVGAQPYDLIVADFTLPSYDGFAALAHARKVRPEAPFVFFSGTIGEERAVECLKNGATDCVLKNRPDQLLPAIHRALREADEHRQRSRAEEALKKSEERLREMAENIREVFWSTSPDGTRLLYGSPVYEQIWRRPLAEWSLRPSSRVDAVVPADQPRLREALAELRRGTPYKMEYQIAWPDGTLRWIEDRGYPVNNLLLGRVERLVGVATDISDRKQLEEQLQQAQKMEAIGQLAGGIAHDFNNMLTVINGRAQMLLDNPAVPPEMAESIRDIFVAGERAAKLTRQLLVFSRKQFMLSQPVNVNEVIEDAVRMLRSMIGGHIRMELDLALDPPVVRADAGMLEQVLMNLVVNARDAMPEGGRLAIATSHREIIPSESPRHPESAPGRHVCIEVRDTGGGIPPEIRTRIFEPFFTTKPLGKGTGLGLSTVFGIAKRHHGWVEVESEVGTGTAFKVFLPVCDEQPDARGIAAVEKSAESGTETILLVEDETAVRDFANAVLHQRGYRVLQSSSGMEAMEAWRWHAAKISLLVTDLVMPGELTGIELAKKLRAERPDLRVIFVSGYSPESTGPAFASLTGMNFLLKPYTPRALAQMVREVLDRGKAPIPS
ncbi:MAG TPA: response regulator [Candidatus Didemnitutus sp.]